MRVGNERLPDILGAIDDIERYAVRGRDVFLQEELVQVWMVHHLQIIGEAAAHLPPEMHNACPHVPWKQIVGLRDLRSYASRGILQCGPLSTESRTMLDRLRERMIPLQEHRSVP